jgi:hypothetical protein
LQAVENAPARTPANANGHASVPTVDVDEPVRVGGILVDPGRYEVRVDESRERIVLSNDERVYALTGFFRASKVQVKTASAQLRKVDGETRRLLVVRVPPGMEWIA